MPNLHTPPEAVQADLDALNAALDTGIPAKRADNLLIGTWNIRKFGGLTRSWAPPAGASPTRDLRALRAIIDIMRRFDVIAVQEVTGDLRALRDTMKYLGDTWGFLMTDITQGTAGNHERLAFLFDRDRVVPSGLACEVVVPPEWIAGDNPAAVMRRQFARTPYAVSFRAGSTTFILVTAHIDYGDDRQDRIPELKAIALWLDDWARQTNRFHQNLLTLGDFNIDRHGDELWQAFTSTGLTVPSELDAVKRSIFVADGEDPRRDKFYDQIAWFSSQSGRARLQMKYRSGGGFDFLPFVYSDKHLTRSQVSHRVSDHYPLWVTFER